MTPDILLNISQPGLEDTVLIGMLVWHVLWCSGVTILTYGIASLIARRLLPLSYIIAVFTAPLLVALVIPWMLHAFLVIEADSTFMIIYYSLLALSTIFTAWRRFPKRKPANS